eukprot:11403322-Alexandrium_andersonii.AAC.1
MGICWIFGRSQALGESPRAGRGEGAKAPWPRPELGGNARAPTTPARQGSGSRGEVQMSSALRPGRGPSPEGVFA